MTSRTFALSRQRRRHVNAHRPLAAEAPDAPAAAAADEAFGEAQEHAPRGSNGQPLDAATQQSGARPDAPALPHERDEHADAPGAPRAGMMQAERDLASGQVDTDLRGKAAHVIERSDRRRSR